MRFLVHSVVAATMLIATSAIGSKAEAAMMPSVGTLPAQTKNYTPVKRFIGDDTIAVAITAMATLIMAMAITDPIMAMATGPMTTMATGPTVTMVMGVAGATSLIGTPDLIAC